MINFIKELTQDTLKNKDNKYSSKKIMSFVAYNSAIAMCWFNVCINWYQMIKTQCYNPDINTLLLLFGIAGYSSTLTVVSNSKTNKSE